MNKKLTITVLVPAHNEEVGISACVESCLNQTRLPDKILVVNDGSTDKTGKILSKFGKKIQVVTIAVATGNKSYAQEKGLSKINTDVFIATDGDTILHPDFIKNIETSFTDPTVAAVGGYIKSMAHNWLTGYRELEYILGQDIYKSAQSYMNAIYVIPGCAGAFRTEMFKKYLKFDHDTLTEDLDFTFRLHKNDLKIVYNKNAIVYTQDPATLSAYTNQIRRWYAGGWQNLLKHYEIFKRPANSFQISLTYIESMFFSVLIFLMPFFSSKRLLPVLVSSFAMSILVGTYGAIRRKRFDLVLASLLFPLMTYLNSYIFLEQFVKEVILRKKSLVWFKPARWIAN